MRRLSQKSLPRECNYENVAPRDAWRVFLGGASPSQKNVLLCNGIYIIIIGLLYRKLSVGFPPLDKRTRECYTLPRLNLLIFEFEQDIMPTVSTRQVDGRTFARTPVKTHLVMFGEDLAGVLEKYSSSQITSDTIICLSEKFVTICQNNVRHIDDVKYSWLARLIVKYVTKYPNDIGYSHPKKMQVAIDLAGYPRMILAVLVGGFTKFVLRRRGDFYRVAGHRIAEIDGFNPEAMAPFDKYAMLPPKEPDATCEALAQRFGCACYIIDGNNINVEVIGASRNLQELRIDRGLARKIMLDNPMGQNDELTPIFLIREQR